MGSKFDLSGRRGDAVSAFFEKKLGKKLARIWVLTTVDVTCFQQAENSIRQAEFAEILQAKFQPAIRLCVATV